MLPTTICHSLLSLLCPYSVTSTDSQMHAIPLFKNSILCKRPNCPCLSQASSQNPVCPVGLFNSPHPFCSMAWVLEVYFTFSCLQTAFPSIGEEKTFEFLLFFFFSGWKGDKWKLTVFQILSILTPDTWRVNRWITDSSSRSVFFKAKNYSQLSLSLGLVPGNTPLATRAKQKGHLLFSKTILYLQLEK